jgi:DNA-binding beta-propeller fold protein YncE
MPDASQYTELKRLLTSSAADQHAGPNKFRAPRMFDGWNPGQLIKFGRNALLSNKFIPQPFYEWFVSTFFNGASVSGASGLSDIVMDTDGTMYGVFSDRLFKITPDGTVTSGSGGTVSAGSRIALFSTFIYVASTANATPIRRYNKSDLAQNNTGFTPITTPNPNLRALDIDPSNGEVYFLNANSSIIFRINSSGNSGTLQDLTGGNIDSCRDVLFRREGGVDYLYYTEAGGAACISRINLSGSPPYLGTREDYVGVRGGGAGYSGDGLFRNDPGVRIRDPRGLTFDSKNNLYFTDVGTGGNNQCIRVVDGKTGIISTLAGGPLPGGVNRPAGYDGDGGLANSTVLRMNAPQGCFVDSVNERLYVAESGNNLVRVYTFRLNG